MDAEIPCCRAAAKPAGIRLISPTEESGIRSGTPALRRCVAAAVLALAAAGTGAQSAADATMSLEFDEALAAYERNHWLEAYRAMSALATRGHPEAARISVQMWRHGPQLYGQSFTASAAQVERWTQLWGCGGDATGRACEVAMRAP